MVFDRKGRGIKRKGSVDQNHSPLKERSRQQDMAAGGGGLSPTSMISELRKGNKFLILSKEKMAQGGGSTTIQKNDLTGSSLDKGSNKKFYYSTISVNQASVGARDTVFSSVTYHKPD